MIDVSKKVEKPRSQKHFVTYAEVAGIFIDETVNDVMAEVRQPYKDGVLAFAEYLEQRNTIGGDQLTILAIQKAREIETEILNALIDEVGVNKAQEIMRPIVEKHRRHAR